MNSLHMLLFTAAHSFISKVIFILSQSVLKLGPEVSGTNLDLNKPGYILVCQTNINVKVRSLMVLVNDSDM